VGRIVTAVAVTAVASVMAPGTAQAAVKAGVAEVDASWHVGASAGQYAGDGTAVGDHGADPNVHAVRRTSSYGRQSALKVRAIVIQGPSGDKVAIVKNDLYIPGDSLHRRTAQLLEAGSSGIRRQNLTMAVTHNHSSPYYSSPSFGVWTFQDVFDVRFYDYYARKQAEAVEKAAASMKPVRVGASVNQLDKVHRHSFGGAVADDGTPAGYPVSDSDHDMTVVRFDDISDRSHPKPLANLVNYPLHGEFLEGNDLISADWLASAQRMTDRQTKAMTIFTQSSTGTAEPERSAYHPVSERLEFTHKQYGQAEYAGRLMADSIHDAWKDIERGDAQGSGDPDRFVRFASDFPVKMIDKWYPGPASHPYPGVSNCRTDKAFDADPQVPIAGLPDCAGTGRAFEETGITPPAEIPDDPLGGASPGLNTDDFQRLGIPVPENYSAPSYGALQEDLNVHLQAFRLGDILFTVCSCEQWKDQGQNIKTRTDRKAGNEYLGYDWKQRCTQKGDNTWNCPNPTGGAPLTGLSDQKIQRMHAQVVNPANGWNDLANAASAESEPTDVSRIKGNYTHDDDQRSAQLGYKLTVPVGMANDYNGYIATYREYQRGDAYRKALTAWGPHSSDYMATRLVTLGRLLQNPSTPLPTDQTEEALLEPKVVADNAFEDLRASAFGTTGRAAIMAYEAKLRDDGGRAGPVKQPEDTQRFGAALFAWNGGSNFTDNPRVRVEHKAGGGWTEFGDDSGEVPVTIRFPQGADVPAHETGSFEWHWTAHFEAFVSRFDLGDRPRATPPGSYRFKVTGERREGGTSVPYTVTSDEFEVKPWSGVTVDDVRREGDGRVSLKVGPRNSYAVTGGGPGLNAEIGPIDYPDSYDSPARFIDDAREFKRDPAAPGDAKKVQWYCLACSWRPWADAADADRVTLTFVEPGGRSRQVAAKRSGDRWLSERVLRANESAYVGRGCAVDAHGNFNGSPSAVLGDGAAVRECR